jgi:hypothetical protein
MNIIFKMEQDQDQDQEPKDPPKDPTQVPIDAAFSEALDVELSKIRDDLWNSQRETLENYLQNLKVMMESAEQSKHRGECICRQDRIENRDIWCQRCARAFIMMRELKLKD